MKKDRLFAFLERQPVSTLLEYLEASYDEMTVDQREAVFRQAAEKAPRAAVDGQLLIEEIENFKQRSLAKEYYHPFAINSKNFMHVPEETREWCDQMAEFLQDCGQLTKQGDHAAAVAGFAALYELMDVLDRGEEIIFGEEVGSWMIPCERKDCTSAYLTSLAATSSPEEFAGVAVSLIRHDSFRSFADKVYETALHVADKAQKAHLKAEIERLGIRTPPEAGAKTTK